MDEEEVWERIHNKIIVDNGKLIFLKDIEPIIEDLIYQYKLQEAKMYQYIESLDRISEDYNELFEKLENSKKLD